MFPVGLCAVVIDPDRSRGGEHADVLKDIVHLGRRLGDPLQIPPATPEELDPVENTMIVAARLDGVDPCALALGEHLNDPLRRIVFGHLTAHRLRVVRVAAKGIPPDNQAREFVAAKGHSG
jgi:hypothetical protein